MKNPISQTQEAPWERSRREGGVKKPWKKGGICGDKNKSWDIFALPVPVPRFLGASFAPEHRPLPHPSSQGGLCKSSPSSRESGLIQYYRVEKERKNLAETAEPAEKNSSLKKKRKRRSQFPAGIRDSGQVWASIPCLNALSSIQGSIPK